MTAIYLASIPANMYLTKHALTLKTPITAAAVLFTRCAIYSLCYLLAMRNTWRMPSSKCVVYEPPHPDDTKSM